MPSPSATQAVAEQKVAAKSRVQLDFSAEALYELDQLKTKIGAASRAEVVRYSLRTLQWVLDQLEDNTRIVLEANGKSREVVFPFLQVNTERQRQVAAL
jgi:hypothetical protein